MFRAGIEIKLKAGWKTYWRYPGDSGVPPVVDFSHSQNVKAVTVLYPAPARFPDGASGTSIGYTGRRDLAAAGRAAGCGQAGDRCELKLDYAVCEKLCVPAEAKLELTLTGSRDARTMRRSPPPRRGCRNPPPSATAACSRSARSAARRAAGKPRVVIDLAAPAGTPVVLFAEGPTPDWALPLPEPVAGAPAGLQRFAFELDGLPPGTKPDGATLRLTAVAGDKAIEVGFRLD